MSVFEGKVNNKKMMKKTMVKVKRIVKEKGVMIPMEMVKLQYEKIETRLELEQMSKLEVEVALMLRWEVGVEA